MYRSMSPYINPCIDSALASQQSLMRISDDGRRGQRVKQQQEDCHSFRRQAVNYLSELLAHSVCLYFCKGTGITVSISNVDSG